MKDVNQHNHDLIPGRADLPAESVHSSGVPEDTRRSIYNREQLFWKSCFLYSFYFLNFSYQNWPKYSFSLPHPQFPSLTLPEATKTYLFIFLLVPSALSPFVSYWALSSANHPIQNLLAESSLTNPVSVMEGRVWAIPGRYFQSSPEDIGRGGPLKLTLH